jgi:hypothetical protein
VLGACARCGFGFVLSTALSLLLLIILLLTHAGINSYNHEYNRPVQAIDATLQTYQMCTDCREMSAVDRVACVTCKPMTLLTTQLEDVEYYTRHGIINAVHEEASYLWFDAKWSTFLLAQWVDFIMHAAPNCTFSSICFWCVYFIGKMVYCAVFKQVAGVQSKWKQAEDSPPADFYEPSTDDLIKQAMLDTPKYEENDIIDQTFMRAQNDSIRRRYVL